MLWYANHFQKKHCISTECPSDRNSSTDCYCGNDVNLCTSNKDCYYSSQSGQLTCDTLLTACTITTYNGDTITDVCKCQNYYCSKGHYCYQDICNKFPLHLNCANDNDCKFGSCNIGTNGTSVCVNDIVCKLPDIPQSNYKYDGKRKPTLSSCTSASCDLGVYIISGVECSNPFLTGPVTIASPCVPGETEYVNLSGCDSQRARERRERE